MATKLRLLTGGASPLSAANDPDQHPFTPAPAKVLDGNTGVEIEAGPDVTLIWQEFVSGDATLRALAKKHGASVFGLIAMARREGWEAQRRDLHAAQARHLARAA